MYRRLPPLNAVKTFEAAARLQNFTAAAAELGVTHGAVSRQIQILEQWLGGPLFLRSNRKVVLTADGQTYLLEAGAILDRLALATGRLVGQSGMTVLRVNASQTFTMRWLIPRLSAFAREHPNIEVRLTATNTPVDTIVEPFDVVIRRGPMQRSDFTSTAFLRETCLPVMSPKLFDQLAVSDLADLQRHTLLHAESLSALWPSWLDAAGVPDLRPSRELRFEHLYYALQAAIDGVGIAMGPSALVADDVRMGRLMAPIPNPMLTLGEFHILPPRRAKGHEGAHAFRDWLLRSDQEKSQGE